TAEPVNFLTTGSPTIPGGSVSRAPSTVSRTRSRKLPAYRKNLWTDAEAYVEIWLEKDALAGVVYPVTSMYDVPLDMRRYRSCTARPSTSTPSTFRSYIYHLGDFDPSGVNAGEKIEEALREQEQIADWDLPTRPTKASDTRAKAFGSTLSVELDAIEPNQLRALVQEAIEL